MDKKLSADVVYALSAVDEHGVGSIFGGHNCKDESERSMRRKIHGLVGEICANSGGRSSVISAAIQGLILESASSFSRFDSATKVSKSHGCTLQWIVSGRGAGYCPLGVFGLFDHMRRFNLGDGSRVVVTQPYNAISGQKLDQVIGLTKSGFDVSIEPVSFWYPGRTSMVIIGYSGSDTWTDIKPRLIQNGIHR